MHIRRSADSFTARIAELTEERVSLRVQTDQWKLETDLANESLRKAVGELAKVQEQRKKLQEVNRQLAQRLRRLLLRLPSSEISADKRTQG